MSQLRGRIAGFSAGLPPTFWYLWLGTVINRLGGFVVPFLSLYLTTEQGIPVAQAGLVVALWGAGAFVSALVGGELTDRLGRRPVLLLSLLCAPPLMVILGLARGIWLIGIVTTVLGFFTELYRPAVSAAVTDVVAPEHRTRAFGLIYWAINLGAAVAPMMAGLMAQVNYLWLFLGDAATTLLYGLLVLARVRETQPKEAVHAARVPMRVRLGQLASEPVLLAFSFLTLFFGIIYSQAMVTLPLDMKNHGLGPEAYGVAAAANAILIVLITIQMSRRIASWRPFTAMALAGILLGTGFGMNVWATTLPLYILAVLVWTLAEIIGATVSPTIIADLSPPALRGLYQGIFGSAWGLAFFLGPVIGGYVFERLSPDALWLGCAALGILLALGYLNLSAPARHRLAKHLEGGESLPGKGNLETGLRGTNGSADMG